MPEPSPTPDRPGPPRRGPAPAADAARILVVDDNAMNVELLAVHLGRLGYAVLEADGGPAALARIADRPPDVVLMDVVMPGLSGFDVLRRLRADPATADLPVILVTGLGETRDIVEGLRLGANDYVTKPIDLPVLQARLATQAALKRARDDLKQAARRLAEALERRDLDLQVAGHVQRSLLPPTPPATAGLETAWCYEPATEVGGDLFDVIPLAGGRTLLFVADAMGHGVQAALVAATVKATLLAHLDEGDDLPRLLARLDEAVGLLFEDRFVTAAACVVDPAAGALHYALAGHPPVLLAGPDGLVELPAGGLPLGTRLGRPFRAGTAAVAPGSRLLLYSDGLIEAQDPSNDLFGLPRLSRRFAALAEADPTETVLRLRLDLDAFRGPRALEDDLTVLTARVLPVSTDPASSNAARRDQLSVP